MASIVTPRQRRVLVGQHHPRRRVCLPARLPANCAPCSRLTRVGIAEGPNLVRSYKPVVRLQRVWCGIDAPDFSPGSLTARLAWTLVRLGRRDSTTAGKDLPLKACSWAELPGNADGTDTADAADGWVLRYAPAARPDGCARCVV